MRAVAGVFAWAAAAAALQRPAAPGATGPGEQQWESRASSGCGREPPQHAPGWPGWFKFQVQDAVVGPLERWWVMHIPESYDPNVPMPLVFDIHGFSSNGAEQSDRTWVSQVADTEGFIVAYPDGIDDAFSSDGSGEKGWNAGGTVSSPGLLGPTCVWADNSSEYSCYRSCKFGPGHSPPGAGHNCFQNQRVLAKGCDSTSCVDDQYFLEQLMRTLQESYCIERRRIHVTGFSNGAMMTYQLAIESQVADQIASIAPVAGAPMVGFLYDAAGRPRMKYPMGVLDMKGTLDDTIPANISNGDGGRPGPHQSTLSTDGFYYSPTENLTRAWADLNKCDGGNSSYHYETEHDGVNDFYCVAPFGQCDEGGPVVRCSFDDGHNWPFYYNTERAYYAETVWNFFKANPLSAAEVDRRDAARHQRSTAASERALL